MVGLNFHRAVDQPDRNVDYDATVAKVQTVVDGYPGLYRDLLTYLRERIKEVLTGAAATIVVRIFGPDLDGLRRRPPKVGGGDSKVDGVADLQGAAAGRWSRRSQCGYDRSGAARSA